MQVFILGTNHLNINREASIITSFSHQRFLQNENHPPSKQPLKLLQTSTFFFFQREPLARGVKKMGSKRL